MATEDTEANILNNLPGFDDDDNEGNNVDTATTETPEAEGSATTEQVAETSVVGSATDTPAKPTEPAPIIRKDGFTEVPSTSNPGARDLVDPATGQIVARGGIERRIFEASQKVHRENATLLERVKAAETSANNANELVKLGTTLQLSPQDQTMSLNLMAQFLKDPVRLLEQLVIEVKSKGYEIPFLATGITPGMDTAAMQRMLDQKMAPITEQRVAQEQQQRAQVEAKKTLDNFLDDHPEGEHNLTVLAEMMTTDPGLTIDRAYMKLIKWCHSNGYDYSQPLAPQMSARRAQQPAAKTAPTPELPRTPTMPLPNGRTPASAVPVDEAAMFDHNASWEDLIRHSMRVTGMSS